MTNFCPFHFSRVPVRPLQLCSSIILLSLSLSPCPDSSLYPVYPFHPPLLSLFSPRLLTSCPLSLTSLVCFPSQTFICFLFPQFLDFCLLSIHLLIRLSLLCSVPSLICLPLSKLVSALPDTYLPPAALAHSSSVIPASLFLV